jgi:SAM-dependent methyltransferase
LCQQSTFRLSVGRSSATRNSKIGAAQGFPDRLVCQGFADISEGLLCDEDSSARMGEASRRCESASAGASRKRHMRQLGFTCWICGSSGLRLVKSSNLPATLSPSSLAITDSNYGTTGEIHRCGDCGFMQCSCLTDLLRFYEGLEDTSYEAGRAERSLQARRLLLRFVQRFIKRGRLLDIGAGSGILVEQALKMGYLAEGVEPSQWLQAKAKQHGLNVLLGTFPHAQVVGPFDVVTLVDVLEHVPAPLNLLEQIAKILASNGVVLIVTPDVGSVAARLLGWRWWHFRMAHICYFNRSTLLLALDRVGMKPIVIRRPSWYFSVGYLTSRVHEYLPPILRMNPPNSLKRLVLPLNLRDSLAVVATRKY